MWSDLRTVRPCFRGWWEWRCEQCIIWILKKLQLSTIFDKSGSACPSFFDLVYFLVEDFYYITIMIGFVSLNMIFIRLILRSVLCNFRPKMPPFHMCTYIRITCYLWQLNTLWCNLLLLLFYLDAVRYGIREQGIFRIKFCWTKCQFYLSHW